MSDERVFYFNRYSERIEEEKIYGDRYLRWVTGNLSGRFIYQTLVKRTWFSRWYGWRMKRRSSKKKILPFIEKYNIDVNEFEHSPEAFATFNEFFYRSLKREKRPIIADNNTVVFPADGRHLGFQDISKLQGIFVKGQMLNYGELLGNHSLADRFYNGTMIISRLCPIDYHRFHFPVSGIPGTARYINGFLASVNPIALRRNIHALSENKRVLTCLDSEDFGQVLILEVGATCVGSIINTYKPDFPIMKGEEKGYFSFGGSAVITLFQKNRIQLDDDLLLHSEEGCELYAHMGDHAGSN